MSDTACPLSSLETDSVKWALCTVAQRAFSLVSPIDGLLRLLLQHTMKVRWNLEGYVDAVFKASIKEANAAEARKQLLEALEAPEFESQRSNMWSHHMPSLSST
eukprot:Skav219280  [mRNA]  locus=scaffold2157:70708:79133:- [translate_table: standard]